MIDIHSHIVFGVNYEPSTKGKRTRVICSESSVNYYKHYTLKNNYCLTFRALSLIIFSFNDIFKSNLYITNIYL